MGLLELIRGRLVRVGLTATDKHGVIAELVDFMIAEGAVPAQARAAVMRAVWGRERFMSTGMEHGIALPHGVTDAVPEEIAAIGIAPQGVAFESFDGQPTTIVILLLTPTLKALTRVRTLAEIVRVVGDPAVRRRMVTAPDREAVLQVLRQASGRQGTGWRHPERQAGEQGQDAG
ncbi:MAG: PTS sucrose transporter subunit IIABC [Planctomycetota bacterium]|nr:MAG: PTS sucrose transporter subunit IIABC [Planctomycetota bacterium]